MTPTTKILLAFVGSAVVAGGAYYLYRMYNPTLPSDSSGGATTYTLSNGVEYTISAPNYNSGTETDVQNELSSAGFTNISFTSFNPPDAAGYTLTATWNGPEGATLQMADAADTITPVQYTAPNT